jgi:two-component system, LytTR family, sensor kinase
MAASASTAELSGLSAIPAEPGRRALTLVSILAFWALIAIVSGSAIYLDGESRVKDAAWSQIVVRNLVYFCFWAVVSLGVLELSSRQPLARPLVGRRVAGYVLFSVVVFTANVLWLALIWTLSRGEYLASYPKMLREALYFHLYIDYLVFWIIVAAAHAVVYYQRYRHEELETSVLAVRNAELATRLAHSELELLRSQLEPHFVFNALNSISGLVRTGEPERAVAAIAALSELLRYVVQAARHTSVPLLWEIEFVEQYLALQWSTDIQPGTSAAAIPPLVLQPLVENAVKFTVARGGGSVRVEARQRERLECDVTNPFAPSDTVQGCGVGLENTRRRLQASYGDDFVLATRAESGFFITHLELPLVQDAGNH